MSISQDIDIKLFFMYNIVVECVKNNKKLLK